jgi:hypothetical protein
MERNGSHWQESLEIWGRGRSTSASQSLRSWLASAQDDTLMIQGQFKPDSVPQCTSFAVILAQMLT